MPNGRINVIKIDGRVCCASGGANNFTYTNLDPMPEEVGGYEAGTTFDNVNLQNLFDGLFYPYQYPAFTSFEISGQSSVIEVGDSIPQNVTFVWQTINDNNIEADSIEIDDVTNAVTLVSNSANDGTEDVDFGSPITHDSQTNHLFTIKGTNSKSQVFQRNKTYSWQWRLYYGEDSNSPLDETAVKNLRASMLTNTFARTYHFEAGGYKYLCYPATFGTATEFKDVATNLDVPFEAPYIVSVTNSNGITTDYRVHRTTNVLGGSIDIRVS